MRTKLRSPNTSAENVTGSPCSSKRTITKLDVPNVVDYENPRQGQQPGEDSSTTSKATKEKSRIRRSTMPTKFSGVNSVPTKLDDPKPQPPGMVTKGSKTDSLTLITLERHSMPAQGTKDSSNSNKTSSTEIRRSSLPDSSNSNKTSTAEIRRRSLPAKLDKSKREPRKPGRFIKDDSSADGSCFKRKCFVHFGRDTVEVLMDPDEPLSLMKERMENVTGVPIANQKITFDGMRRFVENDKSLRAYGAQGGGFFTMTEEEDTNDEKSTKTTSS